MGVRSPRGEAMASCGNPPETVESGTGKDVAGFFAGLTICNRGAGNEARRKRGLGGAVKTGAEPLKCRAWRCQIMGTPTAAAVRTVGDR